MRSSITKSARGKHCTARIPDVCSFDPTHTVWAHIRSVRFHSGTAQKPSDLIGLFACSECNLVIDGQVKTNHDREFIKLCALEGHCESLMILEKEGIVRV